ncbi:hypothetical protein PFMC_03599 [Plasmodium falciparum CAMP/Malaysia]|uniref:Signal recognition particle 14 kDa protein n=1 Tax=Plasmodium falciparum (isolate Camp / Malaysia) TaxID=5835 RepID=A0A024X5N9_PLAFC|nr:hypothetical protein PFMC_03599 [Plasmodium falciparum CAMP/Malaysia]
MVLLSNDVFIQELNKLCGPNDKKNDIKTLTSNKDAGDKKNTKKVNKNDNKGNKEYMCLIRATDGKNKKISTHVYDNVISFTQNINSIIKC